MSEQPSIFTRIINREAEADIVFEDDEMIAITDIRPKAPVHILVISKEQIQSLGTATPEHEALLGRMLLRVAELAREKGIADSGYKVITNVGHDGGQTVDHLHIHLIGGEPVKFSV